MPLVLSVLGGERVRGTEVSSPRNILIPSYLLFQSYAPPTQQCMSFTKCRVQPLSSTENTSHCSVPWKQTLERDQLLQPHYRITFTKFLKCQPHYQVPPYLWPCHFEFSSGIHLSEHNSFLRPTIPFAYCGVDYLNPAQSPPLVDFHLPPNVLTFIAPPCLFSHSLCFNRFKLILLFFFPYNTFTVVLMVGRISHISIYVVNLLCCTNFVF